MTGNRDRDRDRDLIDGDIDGQRWDITRTWVEEDLPEGERVERAERLRGGWTPEIRRLRVIGPRGGRSLVLRSFVKPFFRQHAEAPLTREADVLALLAGYGCAGGHAPGGRLTADPAARLYWRAPGASAFAPDAEKVTGPLVGPLQEAM